MLALCLSKSKCRLTTDLWDTASWTCPLTAFLHIIPYKRRLTWMIGSTGHVVIMTIGTGYKSLAGVTWLVVTIGHATTVRYTGARSRRSAAGGWWASGTTCWWTDGSWWDRAGRALYDTLFLPIIPKITVFASNLTEQTIWAFNIGIAKFAWLVETIRHVPTVWDTLSCAHTAFLRINPHFTGWASFLAEQTTITDHIFLIGFTWWVGTVGHVCAIGDTWARCSSRTDCCWGAGGWVRRSTCWCWWGWWASRALVLTAFLHIIPHKRWITGSTGHLVFMTVGTGYKSLAGFTWLVVTIVHVTTVRYTGARSRRWVTGAWRRRRRSCWCWWGWWASRALVLTPFLHIIPHKGWITGSTGHLVFMTVGTGYKSLAGFTWLVVTIVHVTTVRYTGARSRRWVTGAWRRRRRSCWCWWGWWASRALVLTPFLHIIPHKGWITGSTGHLVFMTVGTGYKSLAGFTWLVVTIVHVTTVRYTGARSRRWVTGAWRRRRRSCWCWWGWWASRALVLTAFLHIIPHKRWITGSTGHLVFMTVGTGYKSLAGFTWLVVTIVHVTTVRYTGARSRRWVTGAWRRRRRSCWCWWGWWASRALVLTTFLHIIPHKRWITWSTGHLVFMTVGTGYKSLAGFTWLVVTIVHVTTVRYTGARSRRWVTGAWRRRRRSCWWWWCWWASRALVLTAFLHIIPHKRWITGSTGHLVFMTVGTGYKSLAGFTWLVVTIVHVTTVRYTGARCRRWVTGAWRRRRRSCWCWWGWWASRALVLTGFRHIIPHKRWIIGSTGHVMKMTIGTGYKSLAGCAWLVVTIGHAATVRNTSPYPIGTRSKIGFHGYTWNNENIAVWVPKLVQLDRWHWTLVWYFGCWAEGLC